MLILSLVTRPALGQFGFGLGNRTIQNPFVYSDKPSEEISQYEFQITQRLKNYIDKDKFLVIVRIDERFLPRDNEEVVMDTGISVDRLPGLPNYSLGNQITIPVPKEPKKAYSHNISVLLDTSLAPSTVVFTRRLLEGSGLIDESIGDVLNVEFMDFPNPENFWENMKASTGNQQVDELINDPNQQFLSRFEKLLDEKLGQKPNRSPLDNMPNPPMEKEKEKTELNWMFWLGIIFLVVFLGILILQLIQGRKNSREILEGVSKSNANNLASFQKSIEDLGTKLNNGNNNPGPKNDLTTKAEILEPTVGDVKNDVNRIFMEEADSVANHINAAVESNDDTVIQDIGLAIGAANPGMLSYLQPLLSEEAFDTVQNGVDSSRYASSQEKEGALRNFRESFVRYRADRVKSQRNAKKGNDIFQFLEQLNNNQIYQLVKDESEDMSAILLAQLKPAQSVQILKFFEIPKQTILLQRMSNISNIPTSMYKDVATRFSKKAVAIKDMGNVAVDGLQSILGILETLPVQQQDAYIDDIAKYDLDLARKIKEHFLTFDGLLELDKSKLNRALEGIPGSDLAKALIGAKQELVSLILDSKTDREKQILESEMQINQNISDEEKEESRKKLMEWVKDRLKR